MSAALIIVLSAAFFASCSKPTTPPSPVSLPTAPEQPSSLPTPPEKVEWSADGIIKAGEYASTQSYAGYEISWLSDEQYIYIGMKANTTGWVAVAIQPGTRMKFADIVFGSIKDGKTTVYDQFSTGDFGPHSQDTELGGTMDILEFGGKEEKGYTTIEFKRQLVTSDKFDNPISKGTTQILWSYGADDVMSKQINRGSGEIVL